MATLVSAFFTGAHPVIGASGAVMGVLVAFAMANPEREFFLFPLPFRINARGLVMIVVAFNLVSALLGALDPGAQTRTSVATHFGGMLAGYALMKAVPVFRRWQDARRRKTGRSAASIEDAVNNIFKFDEARRKRR
jgi:membrane associated rhomboid family serine protease